MTVIANTTLISNFADAGRLDLLPQLWEKLYISEQVFDEIQAGLRQGYTFYTGVEQLIFPFSPTGWLHLTALHTPDEFRLFGQLLQNLHSGEASGLAIAYHRQWTFLSDDKAARKAATALNVPVSGTIGVLLALVRRTDLVLAEADAILQQMIQKGYHAPVSSLNEIWPG
jgi:predicted nucleic acid-binding protein